jgi:hypothetical protein
MLEIQFSIILFFSIHFQVVQGVYQPEDYNNNNIAFCPKQVGVG